MLPCMYAYIYVTGDEGRAVPLDDLAADLTDRSPHDRALRGGEPLLPEALPTLDATSVSVDVSLHDKSQSAS